MAHQLYALSVPGSDDLWRAIGRVAIRAGQLEHMHKMLVKSIAGITPTEARFATDHMTIREIRERIKKLAKQKSLGESALTRLDCLLNRARDASDQRNELIHRMWAEASDGTPVTLDKKHEVAPIPTIEELNKLEEEMAILIVEINTARIEGFLATALARAGTDKTEQSSK